jgi:hypothetical protein
MVTVFCDMDELCRSFLAAGHPPLPTRSAVSKPRANSLSVSELMTILVWFPAAHDRTFKPFYLGSMLPGQRAEFPSLPRYTRFVELIPLTLLPLCADLPTRQGQPTGLPFLDSLPPPGLSPPPHGIASGVGRARAARPRQ